MERLDVYVVNAGIAPTRAKAQQLIKNGNIRCNGRVITKNGYKVEEADVVIADNVDVLRYVSRGGLKLERAIDFFGIDFFDKKVLDIGASTGGFTDCALQHGAKSVLAVDVGTGIMDKSLSKNPKVALYEKTDIRDIPNKLLKDIEIVTCDVSFISLKSIVPIIERCEQFSQGILLVKPQFECGREIARKHKGIINDAGIHTKVLLDMISYIIDYGYQLKGLTYSPIKGGDGNVEYLVWIGVCEPKNVDIDTVVREAFVSLER